MEEVNNVLNENIAQDKATLKIKKWDHLPIRPETFAEFRRLKNTTSDNAFVMELIRVYKIQLDKENRERITEGER